MRFVIALVYCFMNVAGCAHALDRSVVVTSKENGTTILESRTDIGMGRADFQCNSSRSGRCFYTVLNKGALVRSFSVAADNHRLIDGLPPGFDQCVTSVLPCK